MNENSKNIVNYAVVNQHDPENPVIINTGTFDYCVGYLQGICECMPKMIKKMVEHWLGIYPCKEIEIKKENDG